MKPSLVLKPARAAARGPSSAGRGTGPLRSRYLPPEPAARCAGKAPWLRRRPLPAPVSSSDAAPQPAAAPPRPAAAARPPAPRREKAGAPAARPAPLRSPGDVGPSWAMGSAGRPSPAAPPTAGPGPTTESLGPGRAAPPPPVRTCRGPGRASRRRPPKEGPRRRGCAPIRPRAAPTANERPAAAGRAGTGRGVAAL